MPFTRGGGPSGVIPVSQGGTGAGTPLAARKNLGVNDGATIPIVPSIPNPIEHVPGSVIFVAGSGFQVLSGMSDAAGFDNGSGPAGSLADRAFPDGSGLTWSSPGSNLAINGDELLVDGLGHIVPGPTAGGTFYSAEVPLGAGATGLSVDFEVDIVPGSSHTAIHMQVGAVTVCAVVIGAGLPLSTSTLSGGSSSTSSGTDATFTSATYTVKGTASLTFGDELTDLHIVGVTTEDSPQAFDYHMTVVPDESFSGGYAGLFVQVPDSAPVTTLSEIIIGNLGTLEWVS